MDNGQGKCKAPAKDKPASRCNYGTQAVWNTATTKTCSMDLTVAYRTLPPNGYLHRFNIIASPMCECGAGKETADHFLLRCELFDEQRDALRRRVGIQGMNISMLLGNNTMIKDTVEYIE